MSRCRKIGRGQLVGLAFVLLAIAFPACGGKGDKSSPQGDGGASDAGAETTAGASTTVGGNGTGGETHGGSPIDSSRGGNVAQAGETSASGATGSGGEVSRGGETSASGATGSGGQVSGSGGGGIAGEGGGIAGEGGGIAGEGGGIDCDLVGCAPAWCGEPCESPCGCCPCQQGSVDAEGNRCDDECWLRTAGDVHCQQPWDAGPCEAAIPVYWYNASTNRCEPRVYGGCEGNANRFDGLSACEQDCAEISGPGEDPLPVVYGFSDRCGGDSLTEEGLQVVADFVESRAGDPMGDQPHVLVDLMAGNNMCARMSDIVLAGAGMEAFVDYIEYGAMGYLEVHEAQIPKDTITADLTELSLLLGVEPEVTWP